MISKPLQQIYNNHLATSRKCQGKPFKLRQNFNDLEQDKIDTLNSLSRMFINYPSINQDDFFAAPYKVFPDEDYFPLEYFTSQKAKSTYTTYIKMLENENPDSKESLIRLRDGLKFVFDFCKEKGLTFETYPVFSEHNLPCMIDHLKNHKINYYVFHALGVNKVDVEKRVLDFMFGDFYSTLQKTKNRFFSSQRMRSFANQVIQKLKNK